MKKQTMLVIADRASCIAEGCAGAILKYAEEGHRVEAVILSDRDGDGRQAAIQDALAGIGVAEVAFLRIPALPLEIDDARCEALACLLRRVRPDFIVTTAREPDLRAPDRHHASAAVLKAYAIASAAGAFCEGLPVSPRQTPMFGLEPENTEESGWMPGIFIDITQYFERKLAAVEKLARDPVFSRRRCEEQAKNRAVYCSGRGGVSGCQYAEAFSCFGPIYSHGHFVW